MNNSDKILEDLKFLLKYSIEEILNSNLIGISEADIREYNTLNNILRYLEGEIIIDIDAVRVDKDFKILESEFKFRGLNGKQR